jgi:hypothetical protein
MATRREPVELLAIATQYRLVEAEVSVKVLP